jgi:hypothetical protein
VSSCMCILPQKEGCWEGKKSEAQDRVSLGGPSFALRRNVGKVPESAGSVLLLSLEE